MIYYYTYYHGYNVSAPTFTADTFVSAFATLTNTTTSSDKNTHEVIPRLVCQAKRAVITRLRMFLTRSVQSGERCEWVDAIKHANQHKTKQNKHTQKKQQQTTTRTMVN